MNQIHSASRRQIAMHIRLTHHYKQQCCNAPSEAIALKSTRVQDEGRITKPAGHGPGPSGPRDGRGMGALVVVFLSSVEIPVAWPGHTVTFRAICTRLFGGDDLLKSPSIFVSAAFEGLASQLFLFGCSLLSPSLLLYLFSFSFSSSFFSSFSLLIPSLSLFFRHLSSGFVTQKRLARKVHIFYHHPISLECSRRSVFFVVRCQARCLL